MRPRARQRAARDRHGQARQQRQSRQRYHARQHSRHQEEAARTCRERCHGQCANQCSPTDRACHVGVTVPAGKEVLVGQGRQQRHQRPAEERQRTAQDHQQHQPTALAQVAERLPQRTGGLFAVQRCGAPGESHARQGHQHGDEGKAVDEEARGESAQVEQRRGNGRADHPRDVEDERIQGNGVDQVLASHHVDHERQPRGCIDRVDDADEQRDHQQRPRRGDVEHHQSRQRQRQDEEHGLREDDERPAREAVGQPAAVDAQQHGRHHRGGVDEGGPARLVRQLVGEQEQGRRLHPRPGEGHDLPEEVQLVVAMP